MAQLPSSRLDPPPLPGDLETRSSTPACKHCGSDVKIFSVSSPPCARKGPTFTSRKGRWTRWRCAASMALVLLLPLGLLVLAATRLALVREPQLASRLVSEGVAELELERGEPEVLRDTRTRFVAPSAVRLPRERRHEHLLKPLMLPAFFRANLSQLLWSTSEDSSSSAEADEEGLLDSQELAWEVTQQDLQETTTLPSTVQPLEEHALEWPGDSEDANSTREAQARRMAEYMDPSTEPCSDFYQYACGRWATQHPIPRDKAGFDTFELLRERLDAQLRALLEHELPPDAGEAVTKARDLYRSCMDHDALTQRGSEPLLRLLRGLGGMPALDPDWDSANFDWIRLMAELRRMNNDILVAQWVGPDIKNSDEYIIQLDQTSFGLPTRDYFLQASNAVYLEAYRTFVAQVVELLGAAAENASAAAGEVVDFEVEVAKLTSSTEERRNVSALYRRWPLVELEKQLPGIAWRQYLALVLGYSPADSEPIVVFAERYFRRLANLVSATPPRTVANYLLWRFVRHRVSNLDERFQESRQRFYCALFGREQAPPRWKECVAQVNANMGMALGALFVTKHFDENSKNDTMHMTQEMQSAFLELLGGSAWLDQETKTLSAAKVAAMTLRIGYPDFILRGAELDARYAGLNISRGAYFENMVALLRHASREERARLGSSVNKTQWNTAPAVVNAYYSRNKNQIMFPAGILQPPFYHRHFPRSLNFGGIGVVIGHEITHGFDDKGRLFDREGNMQRWWPETAVHKFHHRAQCLVDQYSQYRVDEVAMYVDGLNTQGENIADNGGIKQAFSAYQRWVAEHGDTEETLPGINATHQQLFFINFAQVWCGAMRPEATRNKLKTAVHSPGKFRVIGTLSNSEDFARVFQCPPGSPMNPERKCSVW